MSANMLQENANLELDTSAVRERTGVTTSSLTDRNHIPVFSDEFERNVEKTSTSNKDREDMLVNQVFGEQTAGIIESDIRNQLFLQTNTGLVIRDENAADSAQSLVEITAGLVMAGIFIAAMAMFYGRKGKGKQNVNNQHAERRRK